jgi:molybdopterin-guanine dinucleotide biosynthesis protein B
MRYPVPIVSVIGKSDSGKTTLIEKLIVELRSRGLRIGTVKHAPHGFQLDPEGKDSWRFRRAGAEAVLVVSGEEIAFYGDQPGDDLWDVICRFMGEVDLVLVEGFSRKRFPKILVGEAKGDVNPQEVMAVIDDPSAADVEGICHMILNLTDQQDDSDNEIELIVDGRRVPLNRFTRQVISNVLAGIVTALHGVGEPNEIEVRIKR